LLLGYSKGESKISPAMVKSCYQDLRLGPSEEKANGVKKEAVSEAGPGGKLRPWWKWAVAVFLIAGILAFLAVHYGDRILSGFVSASVKPPNPKAAMVHEKAPVTEAKPEEKAPAPVAVLSVPEKQVLVVEEVKVEAKEENKGKPSEPALDQPPPAEVRADPPEVRTEPAGKAIVVERGDTLLGLSSKVYGRSNERVLGIVQKSNPMIRDPDLIVPGQKLHFPPLPDSLQP
jgi:nucleoid-associated protein YgaU